MKPLLVLILGAALCGCGSTPAKPLTPDELYEKGASAGSQFSWRWRDNYKKINCRSTHRQRMHDLEESFFYLEQAATQGHGSAIDTLRSQLRLFTTCEKIADYWDDVAAYKKGVVLDDANGWLSDNINYRMIEAKRCVDRGVCRKEFTLDPDHFYKEKVNYGGSRI